MQQPAGQQPDHIPSVSEFTRQIKSVIESRFEHVRVQGEVSQPKISRNGHLYFTLKDTDAQLPCVMWRSQQQLLNQQPEHGDQVIAEGTLQVYPPHGRYQLIVRSIQPAGPGALQQAFERLKQKLQTEGLFDSARKKELPRFPKRIGVITSATGAAFQDMRNTLEKRYPLVTLQLYHASVQGSQATPEIVDGIDYFSRRQEVDLLIVGRGGGSLEDLWAFNEERVARAIADCRVPVISAVGHETDFSISDFVADVRAATPTQAIIMAVPDRDELRMKLDDIQATMENYLRDHLQHHKESVSRFLDNYALHKVKQRIQRNMEWLDWQKDRLTRQLQLQLQQSREEVRQRSQSLSNITEKILLHQKAEYSEMHQRLIAADPDKPLKKGYTRIYQNNRWVRSVQHFHPEHTFEIQWADRKTEIKPDPAGG